jgi:hypothetical protein
VTAAELTSKPVSWEVGEMLMLNDSLQQHYRRRRRHISHSVNGSSRAKQRTSSAGGPMTAAEITSKSVSWAVGGSADRHLVVAVQTPRTPQPPVATLSPAPVKRASAQERMRASDGGRDHERARQLGSR